MWTLIERLKDPHLVLCIQEAFGVTGSHRKKFCQSHRPRDCDKSQLLDESYGKSSFSDEGEDDKHVDYLSDSDNEKTNYIINNWLWYYIFVMGTELGDEIFYATFIPFWFWNIDGAVGRRIVMVWSLVMYIGIVFLY